MFELFEQETHHFQWSDIGNVAEGRSYLGEEMPVDMYRLFQFTMKDIMINSFGKEATISVFQQAGFLAGSEFAKEKLILDLPFHEFVAHLQVVLEEHKIGILHIESFDAETGKAILTISEDLDCSAIPITGETVCNYDEGFLAGILKVYTAKEYVVKEIDCWATGARVCRFEAKVK